jgi:hypothetical protein
MIRDEELLEIRQQLVASLTDEGIGPLVAERAAVDGVAAEDVVSVIADAVLGVFTLFARLPEARADRADVSRVLADARRQTFEIFTKQRAVEAIKHVIAGTMPLDEIVPMFTAWDRDVMYDDILRLEAHLEAELERVEREGLRE